MELTLIHLRRSKGRTTGFETGFAGSAAQLPFTPHKMRSGTKCRNPANNAVRLASRIRILIRNLNELGGTTLAVNPVVIPERSLCH